MYFGTKKLWAVMVAVGCILAVFITRGEVKAKQSADFNPFTQADSYSAVLYNNTNGLPASQANTILQTSDGFIWIGSYAGLVRYDGNTFEKTDSDVGISGVQCLLEDKFNRLWVGTNDNGVAIMEKGEFSFLNESNGLTSTNVSAMTADSDGLIYLGTKQGVFTVQTDRKVRKISDKRITGISVDELRAGKDGLIYGLSESGDIFTLKKNSVEHFISSESSPVKGTVSIIPDPEHDGEIYVGTYSNTLYHGKIGDKLDDLTETDISPLQSARYLDCNDGKIWICSVDSTGVLDETGVHILENLPMYDSPGQITRDYEGNYWFASSRQGVMKLVPNLFTDLFSRYGIDDFVVNTTCLYDGKMFIGTNSGIIILNSDGSEAKYPVKQDTGKTKDLKDILGSTRIRSITKDSHGRLWICNWGGMGLVCCDGGKLYRYDKLPSDSIRNICETDDGSIAVCSKGGLSIIKDGKVQKTFNKENGLDFPENLTVCKGESGDLLLGTDGGGLCVINGSNIRNIGKADGLSSGVVMKIIPDRTRSIYWLVTGNSIAYMTEDGKVTTVTSFPYYNNFDLFQNSKDEMWILNSDGIHIVSTEEMLANNVQHSIHYGIANGLPCTATANSYSELSDEGMLYIAGNTGVTKVNIENSVHFRNIIKGAVPYITADGKKIFPDANGNFSVPCNVKTLTIFGYVFNYSLVSPQVSYCLEGFSDGYTTVNRESLSPIDYTNLPGGDYRFVMKMIDPSLKADKTLTINIYKEKAYYEKPSFYIIIGLLVLMTVFISVKLIINFKMKKLQRRHKEEVERERIRTELETASKIQGNMLPNSFPPFPDRTEFDIYANMIPAKEVGGDFYDFFFIDKEHLCVIIADVSDKGVPAALFMMASKIILEGYSKGSLSPAEILSMANETICSNNPEEMFVTVWLGILDTSTGTLKAANAGHEYPIIKHPDGEFEVFKDKHGLVLGGMDGIRYREYELQLQPGSKLFLYTDGVPEAADCDNNLFGLERAVTALNKQADAEPRTLLDNVQGDVREFIKNAQQADDLTMLCLEYKGHL